MSVSSERECVSADRTECFLKRHGWWLLMVTTIVMLVPGTFTLPLSDVDEARFSGATLEMIKRGEWVVPYFNGEYRFDKPPLTYWWQRLNYAVFGVNDFAARFHSLMATTGVALLIFSFGRRLFSAQAGFLAAFGWLTCVQVQLHGRAAVADMPMIFCIVLAHRALFELLFARVPPLRFGRWFWILYLSLGIGFLAKGPVMFVVPLLTMILYRFVFWREPLSWQRLQPVGLLLCVGVIGLWGVPALIKTRGLFWEVGIAHHVVGRGSHTFWLKTNPLFYLGSAFLSLAPWTACALHGALALRRNWNCQSAFLVAWLLAPYLVFSFYATQIPHYVMPAFPAFFLLVFRRPWPAATSVWWEKLWFWTVLAAGATAALVIGIPLLRQPFAAEFDIMRVTALWCLGLLLGMLTIAAGWRSVRLAWLLPGLVLSASCLTGFMAKARLVVPTVPLQTIFRQMPANAEFLGFGYSESTLVYYSHHVWQFENDWEQVRQRLATSGARCVVCLRCEFKFAPPMIRLLKSGAGPAEIPASIDNREKLDFLGAESYERMRVSGISFERASWVELEVIFRAAN